MVCMFLKMKLYSCFVMCSLVGYIMYVSYHYVCFVLCILSHCIFLCIVMCKCVFNCCHQDRGNVRRTLTEVFPCFPSVVRQMPGYNFKDGARPAISIISINFSYFFIVIFLNYLVILCTYVFCVLFVYSM